MAFAPRAARTTLKVLSVIASPLAAELGYRLWRNLGRPECVRPHDAEVHSRAARATLDLAGTRVATYTWGRGPEIVLLVHGWRSRASRFSAVVRELESPNRTIVAFDAPGNGASSGTFTTVLDYAQIITRLSARHGGFDTIVAHSFGALAAFLAVREGALASRLVTVAGVHDVDEILNEFARLAGLTGRARAGLRSRIERRTFPQVDDIWHRFVAELDPADIRTPLLVVHDRRDPVVDPQQSELIAEAHNGPTELMLTEGLGHLRILSDPEVLGQIARFADGVREPLVADRL
ncbi:alpha/beta fold hydrolase [Pseudolysinimonas sp.]|uniref:alpha/beta fold hydrolase n=1 Tax=Pseudolysinimonas sp. TaxID=2680009 RepID=UPI00286B00AA|nr:alpha/beta fold hydrolase [Pseudolysinimonas sp.]